MKLTPPAGSSGASGRVMNFNFIEAITKLPTAFSPEEVDGLLKRVSPRLHGNLRPLLSVLSDDSVKKSRSGSTPKSSTRRVNPVISEEASDVEIEVDESGRSPDAGQGPSGQSRKRGPPTPGVGPVSKK